MIITIMESYTTSKLSLIPFTNQPSNCVILLIKNNIYYRAGVRKDTKTSLSSSRQMSVSSTFCLTVSKIVLLFNHTQDSRRVATNLNHCSVLSVTR